MRNGSLLESVRVGSFLLLDWWCASARGGVGVFTTAHHAGAKTATAATTAATEHGRAKGLVVEVASRSTLGELAEVVHLYTAASVWRRLHATT